MRLSLIAFTSLWLLCGWSVSARADWAGKGEAGVALSSSNASTTTSSANAKFDLADQLEQWRHAFGASGIYASSKDENDVRETTTNRWEAHQQSDFNFNASGFWFENLRYESDAIGNFEYQAATTTGLGYKVIDTPATRLSLQLGIGYKQFVQRVEPPEVSQRDHDTIASGVFDYRQSLTSNTSLTNKLTVESGDTSTVAENDLALQVKMTDVLALAVGYQLRYNSNPGMRTETAAYDKYDRLATANLVYEFK